MEKTHHIHFDGRAVISFQMFGKVLKVNELSRGTQVQWQTHRKKQVIRVTTNIAIYGFSLPRRTARRSKVTRYGSNRHKTRSASCNRVTESNSFRLFIEHLTRTPTMHHPFLLALLPHLSDTREEALTGAPL